MPYQRRDIIEKGEDIFILYCSRMFDFLKILFEIVIEISLKKNHPVNFDLGLGPNLQ